MRLNRSRLNTVGECDPFVEHLVHIHKPMATVEIRGRNYGHRRGANERLVSMCEMTIVSENMAKPRYRLFIRIHMLTFVFET